MTNRLPSLRGIETFLCVAEVLNFRLASERLNVTVSAISHRIQVLEQELGLQLLDRSHRRLQLTDGGAAFLKQLRPGIQMLQEATLLTRSKVSRPLLKIAAPPGLHGWFLTRIGRFQNLHPGIRLEMLSSGRRRSVSVDVTISPFTANAQRDGARPLINIQISPVCSSVFLAEHRITKPADILGLPLIDTIPSLRGWSEWFKAAGIEEDVPTPSLMLDNHGLVYQAAMEGCGIALGMRHLMGDYIGRGLLVEPWPIACDFPPTLGILINEGGNVRLARAFAAWLAAELGTAVETLSTHLQKV